MKGSQPLSKEVIEKILDFFSNKPTFFRDQLLVIFGIYTGFRIAELLCLKHKNIAYMDKEKLKIRDNVYISRQNMKKKTEGRSVLLHPEVKKYIEKYFEMKNFDEESYVFFSQRRKNKSILTRSAWKILNNVYKSIGIDASHLGTHALRKTFAKKIYNATNKDILATQNALGHKSISSTQHYLNFDNETVKNAILCDY